VSSRRSAIRSRKADWLMAGVSNQTPTIIIRLISLSLRSQAVSTSDMLRSAVAGIKSSPVVCPTPRHRRARTTMLAVSARVKADTAPQETIDDPTQTAIRPSRDPE